MSHAHLAIAIELFNPALIHSKCYIALLQSICQIHVCSYKNGMTFGMFHNPIKTTGMQLANGKEEQKKKNIVSPSSFLIVPIISINKTKR